MKKNSKKNLWLGTGNSNGKVIGAIVLWGLVFALLAWLSTALILKNGGEKTIKKKKK